MWVLSSSLALSGFRTKRFCSLLPPAGSPSSPQALLREVARSRDGLVYLVSGVLSASWLSPFLGLDYYRVSKLIFLGFGKEESEFPGILEMISLCTFKKFLFTYFELVVNLWCKRAE